MEMPVICEKCNDWTEFDTIRDSPIKKGILVCPECYKQEEFIKGKLDEIEQIQWMLDNDDPDVKGNRREYKKDIKALKKDILDLGYDPEFYSMFDLK